MGALIPDQVRRIVPLLGSENDGEALSALRTVGRILDAQGLGFVDLASAIRSEPVPRPVYRPRNRPAWTYTPQQEGEHRRTARRCLETGAAHLSEREHRFLSDVTKHPGRLSVRQGDWLGNIAARLEQELAA